MSAVALTLSLLALVVSVFTLWLVEFSDAARSRRTPSPTQLQPAPLTPYDDPDVKAAIEAATARSRPVWPDEPALPLGM